MSRILSAAAIVAAVLTLSVPLMLLARAIGDPLIGLLLALIVFITATPFLARSGAAHHAG
ncbi:hypothetical protein [Sphingomonas cavernae]|uniref:Uncharacterized protein n=1 Tax=Sphingomonas cavernae TaxID=2320861 RepID=A0A418WLW8_9SPHN|nr:hypothetical protein [Sphingomonas cavernae]RJF90994.1 hypothetical protein D3876_12635 [Sphingomonas cavernae]